LEEFEEDLWEKPWRAHKGKREDEVGRGEKSRPGANGNTRV